MAARDRSRVEDTHVILDHRGRIERAEVGSLGGHTVSVLAGLTVTGRAGGPALARHDERIGAGETGPGTRMVRLVRGEDAGGHGRMPRQSYPFEPDILITPRAGGRRSAARVSSVG